MFDAQLRALFATDEITRTQLNPRRFANRQVGYAPPQEIAPRRLW